jgi:hypothetical protein
MDGITKTITFDCHWENIELGEGGNFDLLPRLLWVYIFGNLQKRPLLCMECSTLHTRY